MSNIKIDYERANELAEKFNSISNPNRIIILDALDSEENGLSVNDLHRKLKIDQPIVSHHLQILKDKGIVGFRHVGRNKCYYVKNEALQKILDWAEMFNF
ncbi:MAG: metalloregulator ArsR/SmtB family transcription factor [Bacteroidota bacterium]|nr:metalloregulator ArsR/SmtB family transcription factor [Bacteroidota bacterium]